MLAASISTEEATVAIRRSTELEACAANARETFEDRDNDWMVNHTRVGRGTRVRS
jgi:hypothetical protein